MFSIMFIPYYDATAEKIREVFESLHLGVFNVVIVPQTPPKKGCKVFINYTSTTEASIEFQRRLMENDKAQKEGNPINPVKIYYKSYRRRELFWNVYLTKTPQQLDAENNEAFTPRIEYPRIEHTEQQ